MAKKASGPRSAKVLNARSRNVRIWLPPTPHGRTVLARTCHKCGDLVLESGFYDKGADCIKCRNDGRRATNWAAAEKPRSLVHRGVVMVAATCSRCDMLLLPDAFYSTPNGLLNTSACRDCRARMSDEYDRDVMRRVREETRRTARRGGYQWTGPELEIASRTDLTAKEVAQMLGRSYAAVTKMRARLKEEPLLPHIAGTPDSQRMSR